MSSSVTDPNAAQGTGAEAPGVATSPVNKGKGKAAEVADESMEADDDEEEDDDEEDDDEEEMDDDDEEDEETFEEIDPSAILPTGRRTRGVRVDYTSKEALTKAGLTEGDLDKDEDDDVEMKA